MFPRCALCIVFVTIALELWGQRIIPANPIGAGRVTALEYSRDGKLLLVVTTLGFEVRDARTGALRNAVHAAAGFHRPVCWLADGETLLFDGPEPTLWSPAGQSPSQTLAFRERLGSIRAPLPCGGDASAFVATTKGAYGVWFRATEEFIPLQLTLDQSAFPISGAQSSPDGKTLAFVARAGAWQELCFWDVATRQLRARISLEDFESEKQLADGLSRNRLASPAQLQWSADSRWLALHSRSTGLLIWDARQGKLASRPRQLDDVRFLAWLDGTPRLAVGNNAQLRVLGARDGLPISAFECPYDTAVVAMARDGQHWATVSREQDLQLWQAGEDGPTVTVRRGAVLLAQTIVSPDLEWLASIGPTNTLRIVELASGAERGSGTLQLEPTRQQVWSPDGSQLALLSDREIAIVRADTRTLVRKLVLPRPAGVPIHYQRLGWSPDGQQILAEPVASPRSSPALFSVATGAALAAPEGEGVIVWDATSNARRVAKPRLNSFEPVFSPAQTRAAIVDGSRLLLWTPDTNELLALTTIRDPFRRASFVWSRDSKRLALRNGGQLEIWDIDSLRVTGQVALPGGWDRAALAWDKQLTLWQDLDGAYRLWSFDGR